MVGVIVFILIAVLGFAASNAVALLFWNLLEKYFLGLKEYVSLRTSQAASGDDRGRLLKRATE
jgi:hypothetical protein